MLICFSARIYFVQSLWKEKIVATLPSFCTEGWHKCCDNHSIPFLNSQARRSPKNTRIKITFAPLPPLLSCSSGSRCSVLCSNGIFRWHRPPMYIRVGFITSIVVKLINHWASKFSIVYIFLFRQTWPPSWTNDCNLLEVALGEGSKISQTSLPSPRFPF